MAVVDTKCGWIEAIRQLETGVGLPLATAAVAGVVKKSAYQAPAAAADVAALKVQFDALVVKLVAAGIMSAS